MSSVRWFVRRSIVTVGLLFAVLTFLFFFFRLLPGSYSSIMLSQGASPESVAAFEARWGLNDPLYVQYWRYITNFLQGNFGMSVQYGVPVVQYVGKRIFNSFILIAPGITVAYILGAVLGTVLGNNRGSKFERYGLTAVLLTGSVPAFVLAILAVIVFAGWLDLFPASGMFSHEVINRYSELAWWRPYLTSNFLYHYILPFSVVVVRYLGPPTLIMRTSVVEVSGQGFFDYLRLTGLPKRNLFKHLMKNSSLPVITLYPVTMTRAIGGLVLIEMVFNWQGIGFTLVNSVIARDVPVVQFVFFLAAAFVILGNFAVDIIYGVIDPRVDVGDDTASA